MSHLSKMDIKINDLKTAKKVADHFNLNISEPQRFVNKYDKRQVVENARIVKDGIRTVAVFDDSTGELYFDNEMWDDKGFIQMYSMEVIRKKAFENGLDILTYPNKNGDLIFEIAV